MCDCLGDCLADCLVYCIADLFVNCLCELCGFFCHRCRDPTPPVINYAPPPVINYGATAPVYSQYYSLIQPNQENKPIKMIAFRPGQMGEKKFYNNPGIVRKFEIIDFLDVQRILRNSVKVL